MQKTLAVQAAKGWYENVVVMLNYVGKRILLILRKDSKLCVAINEQAKHYYYSWTIKISNFFIFPRDFLALRKSSKIFRSLNILESTVNGNCLNDFYTLFFEMSLYTPACRNIFYSKKACDYYTNIIVGNGMCAR